MTASCGAVSKAFSEELNDKKNLSGRPGRAGGRWGCVESKPKALGSSPLFYHLNYELQIVKKWMIYFYDKKPYFLKDLFVYLFACLSILVLLIQRIYYS